MHTAPGHGQDDYLVGLEFDIPLLMPVDDNGRFTDEAGRFAGLDTDEANPLIIDWLREQRHARGGKEDHAQLSALLALPRAGHLPRHRPVVRVHGQERACASDALEAIEHERGVDPRVG